VFLCSCIRCDPACWNCPASQSPEEQFIPFFLFFRSQLSTSQRTGDTLECVVNRLIDDYEPSRLSDSTKRELMRLMMAEARRCGMSDLPQREA